VRLLHAPRALAVHPPEAGPADEQSQRDRARQRHRELAPAALLGGLDARLGRGDLGRVRALLDRRQVGVHGLRDLLGVRGPRRARRRQAVEAQPHERGVRVAGLDPLARRLQPGARGLRDHRLALALLVRRAPGQNLAQDRAQREHVGALVELLDLALRLLGRHVGGRAHHRAHQ
jgi:hypothetical protein